MIAIKRILRTENVQVDALAGVATTLLVKGDNIIARPPPVHFLDCSHTCLQRKGRKHKMDA